MHSILCHFHPATTAQKFLRLAPAFATQPTAGRRQFATKENAEDDGIAVPVRNIDAEMDICGLGVPHVCPFLYSIL